MSWKNKCVLPGIGYPWHPSFDHIRKAGTVHSMLGGKG